MTKILLSGCCGAMGRTVAGLAAERADCAIAAGYSPEYTAELPFPVYTALEQTAEAFDVLVDFSSPKALEILLAFATARQKPMVIATTGFSEDQVFRIEDAAKEIPIFFSANLSLGVSLLRELAVRAAKLLGGGFDVEIVEKHHSQKVDAPSGTALMLANAISEVLPYDTRYVYDRHSSRQKRDPHEIGMHSIRGGTFVGEHEILFAGKDEVLTLTHTAYSKAIFANGALSAAAFVADKAPGLYTMSDLVSGV